MRFAVSYPDSDRKADEFDSQQDAIEAGLRAADEATAEVHDTAGKEPVLLARYERRAEPIYANEEADVETPEDTGNGGNGELAEGEVELTDNLADGEVDPRDDLPGEEASG